MFHSVSQNNFAAVQFATLTPTQENFGKSMFDIKDTIMKLYGKDVLDLKMEAASSLQAAASYLRAIGCIILSTIRNYRLVFSGLLVVILYLILVVYDTKIDIGPIQISSNVGLESSEKISERSQYLSSFENRFYSVFDEIEQYPYSNLHKEPKLRLGFTMMVPEFLFRALRTKELTEFVQSSV